MPEENIPNKTSRIKQNFVHLHAHTHYSVQDALPSPAAYALKAREMGFPAAAITDHGRMSGIVEFAEACRAFHPDFDPIKPLLGCCIPGQLIVTDQGVKPIEEIQVGDRVLTHQGRFRPVLRTMTRHYQGALYGVNAVQSEVVWLTDEHPVHVYQSETDSYAWVRADQLRYGKRWPRKHDGVRERQIDTYQTYATFPRIRCSDSDVVKQLDLVEVLGAPYIERSGVVVRTKTYNKYDRECTFETPARVDLTTDLAFILGLYCAEGSSDRDSAGRATSVRWTLSIDEMHLAERVQNVLCITFGASSTIYQRPEKNIIEVVCSSTVLARCFEALIGSGAANKRIPAIIYSASEEVRAAFMDGLVTGDGKTNAHNGQVTLRMKSPHAIYGVRVLAASMGVYGKAYRYGHSDKTCFIFTYHSEAKYRRTVLREEYVHLPIRKVEQRFYDGPVYNFEVAEDNSYVTDITLHNCEFYCVPDRFDKSRTEDGRRQKYNHLTLIAMNEVGYKNMMRMSAIASDPQVFHYSPRVDWEIIERYNEGIIALSGCLASELSQAVLREDEERSREVIERFLRTFGDRYYIELQYHGIPEQKHNLPHLIRYAKEYNVPTVATNDTHYLERQDWKLHDILIQMRDLREDKTSKNGKKEAYGTHQFYLKSEEEMRKIFAVGAPEAVENTVRLAARVENFLKLDVPHLLPPANIPLENESFQEFWQKNLPYHKANEAYLAFLSFEGLKRVDKNEDKAYMRRMQSELQQIWYMGVTDYFLIQREMVEHMVSQGILFGIRGSGVGSLVNYCLEVCSVDPIRWNLMFERFLNPGRGTQYKIDYAVCPVKKWLEENGKQDQTEPAKRLKALTKEFLAAHPDLAPHGPAIAKEVWVLENQGLASYLLDLADRGIVSETNDSQLWTAYILGVTPNAPTGDMVVSKVAALPDVDTDIDDSRRGEVIEWARERFGHDRVAQIGTWGTYAAKASVVAALKTSERFTRKYGDRTHQEAIKVSGAIPKKPGTTIEEALAESEEFQWYYTPWKEEIEIAKQIVGKISNLGVHAGGVLVASEPICEHSPIENSKGTVCSGYDMKNVERVGLVKYDYLGLATYQQLSIALRLIEKRHGKRIILNKIPLEDPKVFRTIYSRGKTASVFQFASKGMQEALRQVNASNTEDLIAVAALYRPGPMEYIPQYADGKRDPDSVAYAHPLIKKHLAVTYGIMVYQEQAMFLARDMAGFDWGEVDKLRKAISKKSGKDFDAACNLFRDKSLERGIPEKAVEEVLSLMQKFGGYAFNRSHACSYAILSYWTAWLRTYYSSEWMAACIHVDRDDADKIAIFKKECRDDRIQVRDANINESGLETTVNSKGDIMMPLTSIKGVGTRAADLIALQPFESLQDLCWRGRPNRGVVEALARANALSCFGEINKITAQKDPEGAIAAVMELWDELVEVRTQEERRKAREAKAGYRSASPMQMQDDDDDEYAGRRREAERPARPVTRKARSVMNPNKVFNEDLF